MTIYSCPRDNCTADLVGSALDGTLYCPIEDEDIANFELDEAVFGPAV